MAYQLIRADATSIPLADDSIDAVITSPPYFALRSYTDNGEHYDGQIGSEATPQDFLEALWAVTAECRRVLKPSGSMFVNLGDKYVHTGEHRNGASSATMKRPSADRIRAEKRKAPKPDLAGMKQKSLMGLPWRYAIGCIDQLDLILRAEIVWSKPNGLPESVTDRVRRSHEQFFHFTKEPRYFTAVDEIREPQAGSSGMGYERQTVGDPAGSDRSENMRGTVRGEHPLGKLPGSVWTVPTEPLRLPDHLPQHFAAFPSEWPRRLILGWSPSGVCVECGQGRRPVVDKQRRADLNGTSSHRGPGAVGHNATSSDKAGAWASHGYCDTTITGYACDCPTTDAPTTPAVVLDPFCGTGTTVAVANALGRHGIGIDLSNDYLRVAEWRCRDPKLRAKVLGVDPPKPEIDGQLDLLGDTAA